MTETGRRPSKIGIRLLALLVVAGICFGGAVLLVRSGVLSREEPEPVVTSDLLGEQLRYVQELVTVEYHYTNMGKFENQVDFYGWPVPFTVKSFIVSFDGLIKAGVDLSQVQIEVDEENKDILVAIPESKITSHEISEDSIQVFDETRNIFNPISISDYTTFTRDQKAAMEEKAIERGLLREASDRAKISVETLLRSVAGTEAYTFAFMR